MHPTMNIQSGNSEVPMLMDLEHGLKTQCQVCSFDTHKNMHAISNSMTMSGEASHENFNNGEHDSGMKKTQVVVLKPHKKSITRKHADDFESVQGSCFVILSQNVRGLTSQNRFLELSAEIEKIQWDLLVFQDT